MRSKDRTFDLGGVLKYTSRSKVTTSKSILSELENVQADIVSLCALLSRPHVLLEIVNDILNTQSLFDQVVRDSYVHNNGFHKIVLHKSAKGHKVRLHVFDVKTLCIEEGVHNHRWEFASTVISGNLEQDILVDSDGADELHHEYVYDANEMQGGKASTRYVGTQRLRVVESLVYKAGTTYHMDTETLHRIVRADAGESLTMTLVITSPARRPTCRLFNTTPIPTPRMYAPQELRQTLMRVTNLDLSPRGPK